MKKGIEALALKISREVKDLELIIGIRDKQQDNAEKLKAIRAKQGVKAFEFYGVTVYARDKKNALRKYRNLNL